MHRFHRLMLVLASVSSFAAVPSSFATVASVSIDWSQLQTQVLPISGLPAPSDTFRPVYAFDNECEQRGRRQRKPGPHPGQLDRRKKPGRPYHECRRSRERQQFHHFGNCLSHTPSQ